MNRSRLLPLWIIALLSMPLLADPGARPDQESDPDQLNLSWQMSSGEHRINGVSHQMQWSARARPNGAVLLDLRIPIESLRSGDAQFDEEMRRAVVASQHPLLEIEGIIVAGSPAIFSGVVRLHGNERPFSTPLSINRSGRQLALGGNFEIDLSAFEIEPPIFDSIRCDPRVVVDLAALLTIWDHAVTSGGLINARP